MALSMGKIGYTSSFWNIWVSEANVSQSISPNSRLWGKPNFKLNGYDIYCNLNRVGSCGNKPLYKYQVAIFALRVLPVIVTYIPMDCWSPSLNLQSQRDTRHTQGTEGAKSQWKAGTMNLTEISNEGQLSTITIRIIAPLESAFETAATESACRLIFHTKASFA